jgi:5'-nucleotidase/UDP-sugar diphosphatase
MKKSYRLLSVLLVIVMVFALMGSALADTAVTAAAGSKDIVILHTNDVHGGYDKGMGYAGLAAYKTDLAKTGYVTLVDAGDFSQGSTMATLSSGEYLVELMNAVGYDIVVPGNHEFDYGMAQAQKNLAALKAKVISCNFVDLATKKPVYDAFTTVKYGDTTVAYVGICTPETYTKSTPTYFQDKNGNYTYSFCENSFYQTIQSSIDAAKAAGAKYVVAVGHCGIDAQSTPWTSSEIIANTTGLCAFIDGHSHSTVASQDVKDKDGKTVVLTQAGTKLGAVGKLTIKADGTITSELITKYDGKDEAVAAKITEIEGKYKSTISNVVAKSSVNLIAKNADGSWACRDAETNMGDLIADAYRVVMGADIGVMNGGGIRDNIAAGDVTMGDILAVMTFGNMATVVKATGQQIKDCLEMGASAYPGKSGGFVQVSGMTYTIDSTVPSSVVKDAKGNFQSVSGEYRVKDIMVAGKPIDLAKTYTVACHSYWLTNYGDGMTMFKGCPTIPEKHEKYVDNYMLSLYIQNNLKGVIGTQYAAPQGRITILCTACKTFSDVVSGSWYDSYVKYCLDNKLMTGSTATTFQPAVKMSRAMFVTMLWRLAGSPEPTAKTAFTDVADGTWYAKAVAWAVEKGITKGITDTTFVPAQTMSRQEMAAFIYRYNNSPAVTGELTYTDAAQISTWAVDAVNYCTAQKLMTGTTATAFGAGGNADRATGAAVITRMHQAAAAAAAPKA